MGGLNIVMNLKNKMIQRRITFPHNCSDGTYCRICEQAEADAVLVKCTSASDKRLFVRFESEEKAREWLTKVGLIR